MINLTRRQFTVAAASAAVAGGLAPRLSRAQSPAEPPAEPPAGPAAQVSGRASGPPPAPRLLQFPAGFIWGCATSAYQIEGAVTEDGRGPSIWDTFAHLPGKTFKGETGDVADDSYHRYKEDVQLLKQMGAMAYRFSISWPRIFPEGTGKANAQGLAYYERLIDELLENGIAPYVTLFHWDLPQALPGGWQSRGTAQAFADYAGFIAKRLSDRVHHFMTINEFVCFTDLSYKIGLFAPGLKLPAAQVNQVRHHALLAHGLAVQAIRANARSGTQVGLAENAKIYVPVIETAEHIEAAKRAFREENAAFLTAVMEGRYTDAYLAHAGADAPKVAAGDMAAIGSPLDFVGLNVYQPEYARAAASPAGYVVERRPSSFPHMASPWLFIGPEVIYWAIRHVTTLWNPAAIYITENGCPGQDLRDAAGHIEDTDRVMFLRNYLTHLQRAAAENYPVRGYFLWSLLDNFEWLDAFSKRFGLYYVDFKTQQRIPKLSASWYREVIARNAVV
jgi:beta-glucosidase